MTVRRHLAPTAICATLLLPIQALAPLAIGQAYHSAGRADLARAEASPPVVRYKTVRFVDTLPGTGAHGRSVAGVPYDPNTPPGNAAPAHIEFSFSPYYPALFAPRTTLPPTLAVYPTGSFGAYHWGSQLKGLQQILMTHPALGTLTMLPYLPRFEAAQIVRARATYLSFPGGAGIAYLTYYAQDVSPVTANRMFYTFQGLTNDGAHYVSASFPVHIRFLPNEVPTTFDYAAFNSNYGSYLAKLVARLNTPAALSSIVPQLPLLDRLFASIAVGG